MASTKEKTYRGFVPKGKGWEMVCLSPWLYNSYWYLFKKVGDEWTNYKLASDRPIPYKGNYELAWNGARFATVQDMAKIKERPILLEWLVEKIEK